MNQKATILIVDLEINYLSIKKTIAEYNLLHSDNVKDGFLLARKKKPELLIVGDSLTNSSILTFIKKLKYTDTKEITILVLTAQSDKTVLKNFLSAGVFNCIRRPVHPEVLKAYIQSAIKFRFEQNSGARMTRSESLYNMILNNSQTAMIVYDLNYNLLFCNMRFNSWFPVPLRFDKFLDVRVLFNEVSKYFIEFPRVFSDHIFDAETLEERIEQKSPEHRMLHALSSPMNNEGFVIGRMIVFSDLTRELLLEQMKDDFLSTASHELRTPLASIKEEINIIYEELVGPINEQQKDIMAMAKKDIRRLTSLVNDLLDFSKIERDDSELDFKRVDFIRVLRDTCESMKYQAEYKHIAITFKSELENLSLILDADKMTQVLVNFLGNSIKFTPDNGFIEVTLEQKKTCYKVSISDTGIGIPPDKMDIIFRKFEQVYDPNAAKIQGTGLGLAISKRIIELHKGEVGARSIVGKGSVFYFTLPIQQPPTILMIDDEESFCRFLKAYFQDRIGWQLHSAQEGLTGIQLAKQNKPDLILLDVKMSGMNGYEVIGRLKEDFETQSIPIIMISAYDIDQNLVNNSCGYDIKSISKPFQPDKLLSMIQNMLNR